MEMDWIFFLNSVYELIFTWFSIFNLTVDQFPWEYYDFSLVAGQHDTGWFLKKLSSWKNLFHKHYSSLLIDIFVVF